MFHHYSKYLYYTLELVLKFTIKIFKSVKNLKKKIIQKSTSAHCGPLKLSKHLQIPSIQIPPLRQSGEHFDKAFNNFEVKVC